MSNNTLTLTLRNDLEDLSRALEEIEAFGESNDWPMNWLFNTNLALDELISNVIKYGYDDESPHEIAITLTRHGERLTVTLTDDGIAYDPFTEAPQPDTDADVDDKPIGGLGVHLVKTLMDEARYERVGGVNRFTLVQDAKA